jgi:hypothetical protein
MTAKSLSKARRALILTVFAALVLIVAFFAIFANIIFQEGNPLPLLNAIIKLEFADEYITRLTGEGCRLLQQSGPENELTRYLAGYDWVLADQMGSHLCYERNGQTLTAEARMFTRRYVVYELDREP